MQEGSNAWNSSDSPALDDASGHLGPVLVTLESELVPVRQAPLETSHDSASHNSEAQARQSPVPGENSDAEGAVVVGAKGSVDAASSRSSVVAGTSSANSGPLIPPPFRAIALAEGGTMSQLQTLCLAPAVATVLARRLQSEGVTETARDSESSVSSVNSVNARDRGLVTIVWRKGRAASDGGSGGSSTTTTGGSSSSSSASDLIPHAPFDALFAGPPDRESVRRVILADSEPAPAGAAVGSAEGAAAAAAAVGAAAAGAAAAGAEAAGGSAGDAALLLSLMVAWPDVAVRGAMPTDPPLESLRWINVSLPPCASSAASASDRGTVGNSDGNSNVDSNSDGGRRTEGLVTESDTVVPLLVPSALWSLAFQSLSPQEACIARRLEAACLGGLQPSPAVAAIMLAHPASVLSRLQRSTAVYLEANEDLPPGTCPGCPEDPLVDCTLRTLAWQYLGEASSVAQGEVSSVAEGEVSSGGGSSVAAGGRVDFIMSAFWAADAAAVVRTFHPLRAPLLLDVTLSRLQACPSPRAARAGGGGEGGRGNDVGGGRKAGAGGGVDGGSGGEDGGGEEGRQLVEAGTTQQGTRRLLEETRGKKGEEESKEEEEEEGSGINATRCAQLQVAEAWVVSAAAALIHTRASLEARFIAAQATAATATRMLGLGGEDLGGAVGNVPSAERGAFSVRPVPFTVAPTVCEAPKAVSFNRERFLRQFIVDENLKTIYCFVPKVACTGWKTWFREQQGQSNVSDVFLTHDKARSGLRILAYHFPEHRVIELLTRPDFFKFSFVRNPYSRLASVYLNKHVGGGPPYSRQFWNKMFFRKFIPFRRLVKAKKGEDLFTFGEFAWLLRQMGEQRRGRMESHVQPQNDVCRFNKIRFDFVGRFENLAEDVGKVLQRLNRTVGASGAFKISKDAHPTNAGAKLLELYDEQSFKEGSLLYAMDMEIPLNGIHFEPPDSLVDKFGESNVTSLTRAPQELK
ncbi:hypothetical protein CLOM_g7906 [Closterium sp. NIES-68]|nr:hypothetical protein CLOM_g7906 [Closterium sp. NIES-68]GJP58242.1 hypothetical protein CLOP_g22708 [Closterium sp. NIES-67]